MLKYRLISFPLLVALGAAIFCWKEGGFYIYTVIAPLALGVAVYEAAAMVRNINIQTFPKVTGAVAGVLALGTLNLNMLLEKLSLSSVIDLSIAGLAVLLVIPALALICRKEGFLERLIGSAGVLLGFGMPLLAAVNCWQLTLPFEMLGIFKGKQVSAMLFLIAVSKSMDTGGYIFGMLSGKFLPGGNHKIAPTVSPKKSWEGFFGGMILTVLAACCFHWWGDLKLWWCVTAGVVLAVGSFFGDLTESALKRRCGIKDSGSYIPGMGGALDVLDSFIYNGILLIILTVVFYGKF
ncbi:MAG: phosphatidate cytidylyltransferase [Lentisphaeria bacterium]|nr:phosphatidate cytidylyltransferase [Lentisphaeria bacterium]